jgi:hypothetical protein
MIDSTMKDGPEADQESACRPAAPAAFSAAIDPAVGQRAFNY